ncbi:MAG TPA: HAD family phosphatase [Anaerolineales bacterium]|nr:HAD family phosphatase [Anaerolineales bacterium]HNE70053.1 HAD family phosphatase [Anaerolineales bacterium]HNF36784.1 HAD family phosphatase [Anaerolineales bacterium]HNH06668.1 HAD family phosphatase [Anaerolineales bacterium]
MDSAITTFIFDFGNVFVKWDIHALYNRFFPNPQAVDSFLEEIRFHEWNAHQDAGRPFKDGIAILSEKYPHYADLIQAYDTHWEDSITDMYHGTVEILRRLKGEGWPIYLLSNFSAEKFPLMRERYEFLNLFDDMIISGEHKLIKPDPAIFQLTLERIDRTANECLFIDDSLANIETARNMGFHTIHFQSPEQLERDLKIW